MVLDKVPKDYYTPEELIVFNKVDSNILLEHRYSINYNIIL